MSSAENSELTKRGFKSWQHFDLLICKLQEESKLTEVALEKLEHLKKENEIRYGLKDYVAKPPEKKSKIVTAKYVLYSKFTLPDDRNIEDAHSYWVEWDKLHVIWTEGETADIYEYGGCSEEMETFKRPDDVFIGYEVAEVYDCDDTDWNQKTI